MNDRAIQTQVAQFIDRYTAEVAQQLRDARARMRAMFPRGFELVYDNYNALAIGYAPHDKASAAILSIAGYPRWVTLFFLYGAGLDDPQRLLEGSGSRVRSVRLATPAQIEEPDVQALIRQAVKPQRFAFEEAAPLTTVIKSVSAKQRARRPA